MNKSRVRILITREHIATHTNLILLFKPALNSSTLVIKLFESSIKAVLCRISYCNTIGQSSSISFATHTTRPLSYKTKALRLVSNVQLVKRLLPCNKGHTPLPCPSLEVTHDAFRY